MMMMFISKDIPLCLFTPERPRDTSPHIRTARASSQRRTATGTAAPTTADTGNTVPQRANPTQTAYAYAHPRRRAGGPRPRVKRLLEQARGTWTLVRPHKGAAARIVLKGTTARSAPQQSPSQMLGSALASFRPEPEGRGLIFIIYVYIYIYIYVYIICIYVSLEILSSLFFCFFVIN